MKNFLLLFLFTGFAFAQNKDEFAYTIAKSENGYVNDDVYKVITIGAKLKIKYYDENDSILNEEKFVKKLDYAHNIDAYDQYGDTLIIAKLYPRTNLGTVSKPRQKFLLRYLENITSKPSDSTAITIIHFYSGVIGQPSDLGTSFWKANEKEYVRKLHDDIKVNQYFIYQNRFNPEDKDAKKNGWVHDKTGYIEKLFIPAHFNYNSSIIIMPDGRTFTYFGEHGAKEVLKGMESLGVKK